MSIYEITAGGLGLLATLLLDWPVLWLGRKARWWQIKHPVDMVQGPESVDPELWRQVKKDSKHSGSEVLGYFERILFFASLWLGEKGYILIGGWLTFKVASKWETWKNVVQVPNDLKGMEPRTYLVFRNAWGSYLFSRFLIGTLYNLLLGFMGVLIGEAIL